MHFSVSNTGILRILSRTYYPSVTGLDTLLLSSRRIVEASENLGHGRMECPILKQKHSPLFTRLETHHHIPKKVYKVLIFLLIFFTASMRLASTSWSRHILKETLGRGQDEAESLKIN